MKTFNVGDLVYCPKIGVGVYTIKRSGDGSISPYCLKIDTAERVETFTKDGSWYSGDTFPVLFKATAKNKKRLSKLYGVEFKVGDW